MNTSIDRITWSREESLCCCYTSVKLHEQNRDTFDIRYTYLTKYRLCGVVALNGTEAQRVRCKTVVIVDLQAVKVFHNETVSLDSSWNGALALVP